MKFLHCVTVVALLLSSAFLFGCSTAGSSASGSGANSPAPTGGSGNASASPSVSAVSPSSGPATGGTSVKITGANFATGALVFFGAVAAAGITVSGPTQIQAVTPSISSSGAVNVVVQNSDGQKAKITNGFTYTSDPPSSSPAVSAVSPSTASPGIQVTVNGTNFASGATVTVGSAAAPSVQFLSPTQLVATVPSVSPGTYDVTVANTNSLSATLPSALTVPAPQSLLAGCTVTASNTPSCALPSGWTDVVNESFEGGKLGNTGIESVSGGSIECSSAHSGSCALQGNYTSSENTTYWILAQGAIGSSHEIYISWWQKDTSGETAGNNNFVTRIVGATGDGGSGSEDMSFDNWGASGGSPACLNGVGPSGGSDSNFGAYNCQNGQYLLEDFYADGSAATAHYGQLLPFPTSWTQFELHYKANTPGNSDGDAELYRNGQLILSASGDLNKQSTMNGMKVLLGTYFEVSGYYTSSAHTTCATAYSTSYSHLLTPFTSATPCPVPPNFTKYWDDIVILKK